MGRACVAAAGDDDRMRRTSRVEEDTCEAAGLGEVVEVRSPFRRELKGCWDSLVVGGPVTGDGCKHKLSMRLKKVKGRGEGGM